MLVERWPDQSAAFCVVSRGAWRVALEPLMALGLAHRISLPHAFLACL